MEDRVAAHDPEWEDAEEEEDDDMDYEPALEDSDEEEEEELFEGLYLSVQDCGGC